MSGRKDYWELLRDPRWQRRRLEILNRSNFRCEMCDAADKTLNVHHRLYRKNAMPWEYTDEELQSLCEDCHERHHQQSKRLKDVLAKLPDSDLDRVIGYAQALISLDDGAAADSLTLLSWEHARGVADALWNWGSYENSSVADGLCDHRVVSPSLVADLGVGKLAGPHRGAN